MYGKIRSFKVYKQIACSGTVQAAGMLTAVDRVLCHLRLSDQIKKWQTIIVSQTGDDLELIFRACARLAAIEEISFLTLEWDLSSRYLKRGCWSRDL